MRTTQGFTTLSQLFRWIWFRDLKWRIRVKVSVGTLDVDCAYPILFAERVTTKYGPSIVITLGATQLEAFKVFLPTRYINLFKDEDIYDINHQKGMFNFTFKGRCVTNRSYIIDLRRQ
jgi:hypothetical protein